MPLIKAQKKSVRQSLKRRVFNDRRRRTMRRVIKSIMNFVHDHDVSSANELIPQAYKAIDKAAKRGVIKKNTASRKKSQISRIVKEASLSAKE